MTNSENPTKIIVKAKPNMAFVVIEPAPDEILMQNIDSAIIKRHEHYRAMFKQHFLVHSTGEEYSEITTDRPDKIAALAKSIALVLNQVGISTILLNED